MPERTREHGHAEGRERDERGGPLKRIGLAEVYNPSMKPTLLPGDQLVVKYGASVRRGDIVVLRHPFQHDLLIVKRAVERRSGGWWVRGDNPLVMNDSREFGTVPDELVVARAWLRLRPPRGVQLSLASVARWSVSALRPLVGPVRPRGGASASGVLSGVFSRRLRAR
ncbi:nickel-type superoxide dismutase maturation protease [Streptomyces sp. NBC_01795]|uniref:nickel-type superoxide dismutase maturation protease n=1 Tax=Streptomyces sp. NBC_01795 TaxID=2975943 RepID=UPI002DD9F4DF|nr:nickel-type superoxide dismutase maturation protease [Streptomyces sp. NBC_01795]WSA92431.1 nickel-type superoxide dismutase maturation protease [Streptomyces sp. NBC_01795]WSB76797.1 nickel-type superoxide dismutase maturation protease [Streptomyces sp. NBC_01775]WSS14926.1 nickel-type superoxide dismutase maturation protease [Streptomyces sp. NBC_01186]WSS43769.1 nickel-type superoxide dismutase maturation protease [Streptomyces sp. NBC_01187]